MDGPPSSARTWAETDSGSNTSSVPRSSTAREPPSTKNKARGSRRASTVLTANRDVVIQSEPAPKWKAAGLTIGIRPDRSASIPMRAEPSTAVASLLRRTRPTLGATVESMLLRPSLEGFPNPLHRVGKTLAYEPIDLLGHGRADHRRGGNVIDLQDDAHALRNLGEGEAALLLDDARLGFPADLVRPPPAVQAQDAAERCSHHLHLHVEARAFALSLGADRLPAAHPLQHLRHVAVVGKIVEGFFGGAGDHHRNREFKLWQYPMTICVGPRAVFRSMTRSPRRG